MRYDIISQDVDFREVLFFYS